MSVLPPAAEPFSTSHAWRQEDEDHATCRACGTRRVQEPAVGGYQVSWITPDGEAHYADNEPEPPCAGDGHELSPERAR